MISTVLVNCQHWKSQFQNFVNEITGEEREKKIIIKEKEIQKSKVKSQNKELRIAIQNSRQNLNFIRHQAASKGQNMTY